MKRRAAGALLGAAILSGCGYKAGSSADLLPKNLRTIAVPTFGNLTSRNKLTDGVPASITREFLTRTRYRVVADPNDADAILNGAIIAFNAFPTIVDPATGRAAAVQVNVILQLRLMDRRSGKVLFERQSFEARQRYEVSVDPVAYFDESGVAIDRLCRDVARQLVSAVLENF
jgi:PBP1b-binding outer membrane lipoprotein LpoB